MPSLHLAINRTYIYQRVLFRRAWCLSSLEDGLRGNLDEANFLYVIRNNTTLAHFLFSGK